MRNRIRTRKLLTITLLLLGLIGINSQANERLYEVELAIFSQDMTNTEVFDQTESQIAWPTNVTSLSSYQQVGSGSMKLNDSNAALSRQQRYHSLLHIAWIQAVKANRISPAVSISNPEKTLNGFFRLQRGNLIHMIVDIEFSPAHDSVIYRLNEKRRFKLNETHYLDHPKFGILARITPIGTRK